MNLASRVENANKAFGTTILITQHTHKGLSESQYNSRRIGYVRVAGKKQITTLYEISGDSTTERKDMCQMYEAVLSRFEERDLKLAEEGALSMVEMYPEDEPAQHLLERIVRAKEAKDGWDIVQTLEK